MVGDEGVGPLNARTVVSLSTLKHILPGYRVRQATGYAEGMPYPLFTVARQGKVVMTVVPDEKAKPHIAVVIVSDGEIMRRSGFPPDRRYVDVFPQSRQARCSAGVEEEAGLVFCLAPGLRHVWLAFPNADDSETASPLVQGKITSLRWFPDL